MAKYRITAPDGRAFEVTAPEGAAQEQVLAYAQQQFAKQPKPIDPTEGMSGTQKFLAGAGKAFYDIGRGVGTLVTDAFPEAEKYGLATRNDIDEAKKLDAPLMNTGAGMAGNIVGNVAAAVPTAMIPGANTVAGGAVTGAALAALQPVGAEDSRLSNMKLGAVTGAAVPLAVKTGKVLKAGLIDPFTEAGRTRIVGSTLNRAAADPQAGAANLRTASGNTPGFSPTAGQAANDAGIASVERTARAIDPAGFDAVDKSQRAALVNALRSVSKTPEERAAAVSARESAVNGLYETAKKSTVVGDPALEALLQRPTVASGLKQAQQIAADEGRNFALTNAAPARTVSTGLLDASGNPIASAIPSAPATYSGQGLHDLKMGIDKAITEGSQGIGNRIASSQLSAKQAYLDWLESKIPEYGQARQTFSDMSKPINQMDIGKELYQRFVPALADGADVPFKARADALAQALRNSDDLARNVTGMKGTSMSSIMEPEQINLLNGVVKDAQMKAAAETSGKGVGSDTVQKMAMSNLISESGLPSWIASIAPLRPVGGILKTAGDFLYSKNDDTLRHLLADVLKDPQAAANAMTKAGVDPSKIAKFLQLGAQAPVMALPAVANGAQ